MKKLPPKIALPIALLAGSAFGAVIENDALKVELREAVAAFDVTDKSSGRVWCMLAAGVGRLVRQEGTNMAPEYAALCTGFANPPDDAKPRTWWHWMQGMVTKEGITRDMEAMKAVGVGGCTLLDIGFFERLQGPVHTLSPEWFECVNHAAKEATRLGLELSIHNCSGWSSSGGPWIRPEFAMKSLGFSETTVTGGVRVAFKLPPAKLADGSAPLWSADVRVLAFPSLRPGAARIPLINAKTVHDFDAGGGKRWQFKDAIGHPAEGDCVRSSDIVDLTGRMGADGTLEWDAPTGVWTVVRFQMATFKSSNVRGSRWGGGLECDKMSKEGVDEAWRGYMAPIVAQARAAKADGLRHVLIDSYEVGSHNWTQKMPKEFRARRGYDLTRYLVTFTGRYVDGGDETEKFLEDFRRTVADLNADWYGGYFARIAHANGLDLEPEPYGGPWDPLWQGRLADCPMGEFWYRSESPPMPGIGSSVGQAAILASVHGRKYAQSEAFTEGFKTAAWMDCPADHKRPGDCAFATGVNRLVFHTYCHQPYETSGPGLTMGVCGFMFNRHNTLWDIYPGWVSYLSRCQFLLQQGTRVADVLYVSPLDAPCEIAFRPPCPHGFQCDAVSAYEFLRELTCEDGVFRLPNGRSWRQLVLPGTRYVTVEYLEKVRRFRRAGGCVTLGPKPVRAFGRDGGDAADDAVRRLADELWSEPNPGVGVGIGTPDVSLGRLPKGADVRWSHRATPGHDIYFVANVSGGRDRLPIKASFRAHGAAELWNAETGKIEPLASVEKGDVSEVSFELPFCTSAFVVFRKDVPARKTVAERSSPVREIDISEDWNVTFQARGEEPFERKFKSLRDLGESGDERVRGFSGTAVYRKTVDVGACRRLEIDLGDVADGARIFANGEDCGYSWHVPHNVDLTPALGRAGCVDLEIHVATRWVNCILAKERKGVGGKWEPYHGRKDLLMCAELPEDRRWFLTYRAHFADDKPQKAGLLGPARILIY